MSFPETCAVFKNWQAVPHTRDASEYKYTIRNEQIMFQTDTNTDKKHTIMQVSGQIMKLAGRIAIEQSDMKLLVQSP